MTFRVTKPTHPIMGRVELSASKSESNRALIIQHLCSGVNIQNLSNAGDTQTLKHLLKELPHIMDVGAAGTTMRFLTAVLAISNKDYVLTGSERMKERPIHILVDALGHMGAKIEYLQKEGYPPLKITGKPLMGGTVKMQGDVSSQYLSALLLIAPVLTKGLVIEFTSELVSVPYLKMTIAMMQHFGAKVELTENKVLVQPTGYQPSNFCIEADWSAASYWYEIVALSHSASIELVGLKKESLQGDSALVDVFRQFGVTTQFTSEGVRITKDVSLVTREPVSIDCESTPDLAQTYACTAAGLGMELTLTGLQTLRIKETDRINALQTELRKFGIEADCPQPSSLSVAASSITNPKLPIKTYHDHRMAMAFAPLAMVTDSVAIENPSVVAKSYPGYWEHLQNVGFNDVK